MQSEEKNKSASDIPPIRGGSFRVEIDKLGRMMSLYCSGVKGIVEFSESLLRIKVSGCAVVVVGTGLSVKVLEDKRVEICGKISEVKFDYGKL